ncbi:MAG: UDP-3-O-[3-hydroxymyristoyl] N-acetylglucosamine deacetylase [Deltaproteobacteria bacterium]|nr:UDP-3-O-[3-hydroxymyristoyl] N-acetylglucosamine deacetylase [Deltaproteobacteria bacterium]
MKRNEKTILVVDDEDGIRETIREVLTDEGYRVVEAKNEAVVRDLIRKESPHLVLLDIWMPDVDGIDILKQIKEQHPNLRVIMISGHGNIHTAVAAARLGAFDFLEKPLSLDSLLETVQRALGDQPAAKTVAKGKKAKVMKGQRPKAVASRRPRKMALKQRTLKKSVVGAGHGLHSGVKTGLILQPMTPHSGILFTGISADTIVPAHLNYVRSTGYATSLQRKGIMVRTVEHFLAALHSYGISNLLVKMHGEIPIMDGSALEFCRLIEEAGIEEQDAEWLEIVVDKPYRTDTETGKWITVEPADTFGVRYILNYPAPVGMQEHTYIYSGAESFREEIAGARTFGFVKDIEQLEKMGLANGGRLSNCILIDDEKIINTDLRFPNELARHKILDIIGDFYLFGRPIRGMVTACMTGHSDNISLLKEMKKGMALNAEPRVSPS